MRKMVYASWAVLNPRQQQSRRSWVKSSGLSLLFQEITETCRSQTIQSFKCHKHNSRAWLTCFPVYHFKQFYSVEVRKASTLQQVDTSTRRTCRLQSSCGFFFDGAEFSWSVWSYTKMETCIKGTGGLEVGAGGQGGTDKVPHGQKISIATVLSRMARGSALFQSTSDQRRR